MIYGVYSIYDSAAGVFTIPTIDISDESAIRNFKKMCSEAGSMMNFKPTDFSLYVVGAFNAETGSIEPLSPPSRLIIGTSGYEERVVDK